MELSLEADRLREIIDIVDAVVAEARFIVDEDELNVRAVDDSHVAMVDVSVLSNGFEKYDTEGKETMALNLEKIQDFLKIVNSDSILNLINESGKLKLESGNLSQVFPLLDPEGMKSADIPDLDLSNEVKMEADYLKKAVKAADTVSDGMKISLDDLKCRITAESDQDEIDMTVYSDQFGKYNVEGEVESMFALQYLKDMISPVSSKAPIYVRIDSDYPMEIEYRFAEGTGMALMMLAPRIEE